jgi:MscS family membrane protein
MELRRQLLDIANQKITRRLKEYGIAFDITEPTVYVDSPITI